MVFELALFACILASKQIKRFFLKPAIAFHFFIILTHGLFSFFFAITALLIAYLDDANDSVKLLDKLSKFTGTAGDNSNL